jgi:hypothetical protein
MEATTSWMKNTSAKLKELAISEPCAKCVLFVPGGGVAKLGCKHAIKWHDRDEYQGDVRPDLTRRFDYWRGTARRRKIACGKGLGVWGVVLVKS